MDNELSIKEDNISVADINTGTVQKPLTLTANAKDFLYTVTQWTKFLAIVGAVVSVLCILIGLLVSVKGDEFKEELDDANFIALYGAFFIIFGLVMVYPTIKMFSFVKQTQLSIETNNETLLEKGFNNMKKFITFYGIITIIYITFEILSGVFEQ